VAIVIVLALPLSAFASMLQRPGVGLVVARASGTPTEPVAVEDGGNGGRQPAQAPS
jgi:hypothetical protein